MEQLAKLKQKLKEAWDSIQDSEAYQQIKTKYDDLDTQVKLYINLGAIGFLALIIMISVLSGLARVKGLKSEIDDKEVLIGYLQRSADSIKQMRAQAQASLGAPDLSSPLNTFAEGVFATSNIDRAKMEIAAERPGAEDKDSREVLVDIKLKQLNLRQIVRFLFNLTDQGKKRSLNIKELDIDTHGDPSGYMDAAITIASYRSK